MISCGESSGDVYAAALTREILRQHPSAVVSGLGGDALRDAGATLVGHFGGISVTGLLEVVRVLPRTFAIYRRLVRHAAAERPDVFVAIDFPDFNFRLARAMKRLGIPVVYYISPQLWAWRPGRMTTMRAIADLVLVIFQFEREIYERADVPVEWVGHPLLDLSPALQPRDIFLSTLGLDPSRPVIALLPGSRPNEVRAILPGLVASARLITREMGGAQFLVAKAPHLADALFEPLRAIGGTGVVIVEGQADGVLAAADLALLASGTATVQAALRDCPMIVVYRLSPLTYRLGRRFVKVKMFAMANLVAGREVVPELIQDGFTPEAVASCALRLLQDDGERERMRADLRLVAQSLGTAGASRRAAESVLRVASRARSN